MKSETITSPLDDLTYDVVSIIQKKAEGLEAYEKYLRDAKDDEELMDLFEEMRSQDAEHIQALKEILARRLEEDLDYEEEDEDEDIDEDEDVEDVGENGASQTSAQAPRRGESTGRR
jgi:hypothetical protein